MVVQRSWERESGHWRLYGGGAGDHNDDVRMMERTYNGVGNAAHGWGRQYQTIEDDGTRQRDSIKYLIYIIN
jgi:hypothetical protein